MATANRAIEVWIDANVGAGDLTARGAAGPQSLPESLLERIDAWPESDLVVPRLEMDLAVQITRDVYEPREDGSFVLTRRVLAATPQANGIVPQLEYRIGGVPRLPAVAVSGLSGLPRPGADQLDPSGAR